MSRPGSDLEREVMKLLSYLNHSFHRVENYRCFACGRVQNTKARDFPDFFIYHPEIYAIECKMGTGRLRPGQLAVKKKMELSGMPYILCHDSLDNFINFLMGKGYVQKTKSGEIIMIKKKEPPGQDSGDSPVRDRD